MKILLLDNFDSFTYNLVHYLTLAGATVDVKLNTDLYFNTPITGYNGLVLSPGPNNPNQSGLLLNAITLNLGKIPMLGVCLGMQALCQVAGAKVVKAPIPVHGKQNKITHKNTSLFKNIKKPMQVGRYHSLMVQNVPKSIQITAQVNSIPMAVENPSLLWHAVQFHPESILTPKGQQLINNWIEIIQQPNV